MLALLMQRYSQPPIPIEVFSQIPEIQDTRPATLREVNTVSIPEFIRAFNAWKKEYGPQTVSVRDHRLYHEMRERFKAMDSKMRELGYK
jgi:hypothetical protein